MNTFFPLNSKIRTFYQEYFGQDVDSQAVLSDVQEDGLFTYRFAFFTIIGCAIATLGLLLNSPVVIIGAMLISPLMGPIVMQGFSLSMINVPMFRKSTITIFIGASLAISISFFIVTLSPIVEINAEILARTSPNLFDLLIAVFSGLAAGYTFIKRKGAAIVGVAIATSLMPPLAVVGYGLATGNLWISEGAFFLFMTNLLAISLSVSIISKLYGFGHQKDSRYLVGQTLIALSILIVLGIPLGISLKNIAFQTYAISKAQSIIKAHFTGKLSRLNDFDMSIEKDKIEIDAVVITKKYDPMAKEILKNQLEESFNIPVELSLVQIALTNDREIEDFKKSVQKKKNLVSPGNPLPDKLNAVDDLKTRISKNIWFPYKILQIDQVSKTIHIFANYEPTISLQSLYGSEKALTNQFPGWTVLIYPSQQHIPPLHFESNQGHLSKNNLTLLETIMWTLKRWNVEQVDVIGYASTPGRRTTNTKLAHQRSETVANILKENGFTVHTKGRFQTQNQKEKEKHKGYRSYQRVDIRLHYDTFLKDSKE